MFATNSNNKCNETSPYGIQLFQSEGETCKTIKFASRIFEHTQEPVGTKDYTLNPIFRPSHKLVLLFSLRL